MNSAAGRAPTAIKASMCLDIQLFAVDLIGMGRGQHKVAPMPHHCRRMGSPPPLGRFEKLRGGGSRGSSEKEERAAESIKVVGCKYTVQPSLAVSPPVPRASCHKCGLLMGMRGGREAQGGRPGLRRPAGQGPERPGLTAHRDNKFRVYMVFLTGEIISPTTIRLWHCSLKLIASDLAHTPVKIPDSHHANGT